MQRLSLATPHSAMEFAPPAPPALKAAMIKAVLVHLLLLLALTWGVSWKRQANEVAFEAELWSAVPTPAAPKAIPQPAQPKPETPPPKPEPKIDKKPPPPAVDHTADIRLQKEREKKEKEREKQQALEQEKRRIQQLQRAQAMAGSGDETSTGSAAKSSGPSATYKGKIAARVIPNITFPDRDTTPGNPVAKVQFKIAPDGTILTPTIRISASSGLPTWDKAVLNAVDKTGQIPRDVDGRFPDNSFELTFSMRQ
jgi:colicin import membrane protein